MLSSMSNSDSFPSNSHNQSLGQIINKQVYSDEEGVGEENYDDMEKQTVPNQEMAHTDNDEKFPSFFYFHEFFRIEEPKFNDLAFVAFFFIVVAGFSALAIICFNDLKIHGPETSNYSLLTDFVFDPNTVLLLMLVIVVSLLLSVTIIVFARFFPKVFVIGGLALHLLVIFGSGIYYFAIHYYYAAILILVLVFISGYFYWAMRARISLSICLVQIIAGVITIYPSIIAVVFLGGLITSLFMIFSIFVLIAANDKFDPYNAYSDCSLVGGCSMNGTICILVFLIFSVYYITEVVRNIVHTTVSGVYGAWYYVHNSDEKKELRHPAVGAFTRAISYSFGSICFGSLIASSLQLLKQIVKFMRKTFTTNNRKCLSYCCYLVLDAIISVLNWFIRYFNQYSYSFIALYGKSYITSSKETWALLHEKKLDILLNDCLIDTSVSLYCMTSGYIVALLAYLYLRFTSSMYIAKDNHHIVILMFCFLISGQISHLSLTAIKSGVSTLLICLAKDPSVFRNNQREKFNDIFSNYPSVNLQSA